MLCSRYIYILDVAVNHTFEKINDFFVTNFGPYIVFYLME